MRNGDSDEFLAANKYPTGAEGLFALHKDAKETLGELGFAVFTDELNQQDAANNAANGQAAGAGAQETQAAGAETQGNQGGQTGQAATTEAQGTQPAQTQGTEPVSADTPVYTLYAPDEDEKTNIDPVVNLEGEAYLKSLERLGGDFTDNESGTNGDGSGSGGNTNTEKLKEADYYREILDEYFEEIYKDIYNNNDNKKSNADTILKKYGYSGGIKGWNALYNDAVKAIGVEMDQSYVLATMTGASEEANWYQSIYNDDLDELAALNAENKKRMEYYSSANGNSDINEGSGGMFGGSWEDPPIPYVTEESTGDSEIVDLIRNTDYYAMVYNAFTDVIQKDKNLEAEIDVDVISCDSYGLTGGEAYEIYQYISYLYYQKGEQEDNIIISGIGDIISIPGFSTFFAASEYKSFDEQFWDPDYNGPLEGEYTLSHFVMDADYDIKGYGGGKHLYFVGTVLWGPDTIEKNDGSIVTNPINYITFRVVTKEEYLNNIK